jgi:(+)-trans-carveol dehydrogenase
MTVTRVRTPRLAGTVALITGAARGQGRSHALRLAAEGAHIIAVDACVDIPTSGYPGATPDELEQTAELVEQLDRRAVIAQVDVRDLDALAAAVDEGVAELGRLDTVAANAGIFSHAPVTSLSDQAWAEMIDINLTGVWHTCRVAIPHLLAGGRGGSITITSSVAGLKPGANMVAYVAAKHGTVGLMRSLALELAPQGIRVNTLHPTTVDTPMVQNESMYRLFRPDLAEPGRAELEAAGRAIHPMGVPWVEPEDVSAALVFLASDDARYISGATVPVDAAVIAR